MGASPTRQPLQPEATGAAMEVTKWLKPSDSASRIGDGASVQAVTRVNAEQASKRTMRRPTRRPFRGRLTRLGERAKNTPSRCAGVVAAACTQGKRTQHGKPRGVVSDDQPDAREGQAGRPGVAERSVIPLKPGNAGEGRGLSSRQTQIPKSELFKPGDRAASQSPLRRHPHPTPGCLPSPQSEPSQTRT